MEKGKARFHKCGSTNVRYACAAESFVTIALKSTIFELQKSFKYKFSCTINFQENETDKKFDLSPKKGEGRTPPLSYGPVDGYWGSSNRNHKSDCVVCRVLAFVSMVACVRAAAVPAQGCHCFGQLHRLCCHLTSHQLFCDGLMLRVYPLYCRPTVAGLCRMFLRSLVSGLDKGGALVVQ